ncbi:reverse transcriptase domain-containing protein [Tanacetum coccineum]
MLETSMEVFMDDFSVFGNLFDSCLANHEQMLIRCKQTHIFLNWEKCHFMVTEGIMLGHKVSGAGLEVDKEKIDVISKLPPPTNVKAIRSFFDFNEECIKAFEMLKEKLTKAPIMFSTNWLQPFEVMCDASDFAVRTVLGQHHSAFKYLFTKQVAKLRLIQWILLLQEFDIEIKNKKGEENVTVDHLS